MSDIADAAEVSRQSIYNQFGSKDAVLDWAVTTFLEEVTDRTLGALKSDDPEAGLLTAFQFWIGDHVPILRGTPHGADILDRAIETAATAERNFEGEVVNAMTELLAAHENTPSIAAAEEQTFVLMLAAKGLLLKSATGEDFQRGMLRILKVILNR